MKDEKEFILTKLQAIDLLGDREYIHTTFNPIMNVLLGADWSRQELIDEINKAPKIQIGGPNCKALGHGLVIWTDKAPLFVEVDKIKLQALEDSL